MALPNPLPDNPLRWDGWKNYNSTNFYDRLCLEYNSNAADSQIEENCRQLLVWWQKKLPLKNQPSNPIAQILRAGLDEAPIFLVEARSDLLNPETRARIDAALREKFVGEATEEFKKIITFALVDRKLTPDSEVRLFESGSALGLSRDAIGAVITSELERLGAERGSLEVAPSAPATSHGGRGTPVEEFRRMLRFSKLCQDGDEMTDDQRDALCNMGESLGLTGGEAEDLIDAYLEEMIIMPPVAAPTSVAGRAKAPIVETAPARPVVAAAPPAATPAGVRMAITPPRETGINTSPLARAQEKQKYPNFTNKARCEMFLVTSGAFLMGSSGPDASAQEQPVTPVTLSCFFLGRHPITNLQYELFDPSHRSKRAPWATDWHPVVYVSSKDAEKFCQWLSLSEGKRYRLPTEAEWEFAARGADGRVFPWGDVLDAGHYANFADRSTKFAWSDRYINDGFAETSPVGSFPRGASPFGIEDMAGNVYEWCFDFYGPYRGKERVNPRGPDAGQKRNYRGGSWKSRVSSLRATARHTNMPEYSSNDVGFRVLCECD